VEGIASPISNGRQRIESHVRPAVFPRLARVLDCSIFYGLLVVIALTAIPYGTVQPWWVALFECLIFFLGILGIIEGLLSNRRSAKNLSLALPLVVLILFMLFQSLSLFSVADNPWNFKVSVSADPYNTRLVAVRLFALLVAGGLLLVYTSGKARLRALISVVIGVGLASALFGVLRKYFQQSPGFFLPALMNDDRGFAQFINRNHLGFLIEMAWGLTLGLLFTKNANRRRLFVLLPAAAFLWIVLIISNSRGGIVASLGQVLFLVVLLDPLRHLSREPTVTAANRLRSLAGGLVLRVILVFGMVVLFAYGAAWVGGESVVSNFQLAEYSFTEQSNYGRANTSRNEIWSSTWKLIKAHPLAGVGFGGYWIGITRYHDATGELTPQEAHNDYLELLASGGLIGLALVLWFAVAFLRRARKSLHSSDPYYRAAALGALVGIFGVMIHSFVDFGLHITSNAMIFCALIVIAVQQPNEDVAAPVSGGDNVVL
jgi:O-antigen ligase